ncbi:hypothetical protein J4221_07135 [Candidatus Pacearchaeota archaeon]|nr:hypothetical protein [Candidatus Pacearchaeota archaeon]
MEQITLEKLNEKISRREFNKIGLVGIVSGISGYGLLVDKAIARDDDPSGTMDKAGLKMFICNYLLHEDHDIKIVGLGNARFRENDRITLVTASSLIYKKRAYFEILDPSGRRVDYHGYDFKKGFSTEYAYLKTTANRLRRESGRGTYAGKYYFNKKLKKIISFEVL